LIASVVRSFLDAAGGGPMAKRYVVELSLAERERLQELLKLRRGRVSRQRLARARVLLKVDQGEHGPGWPDRKVSEALDVGTTMIANTRRRFVETGLEQTLVRKPQCRPSKIAKIDGNEEARLLALACSPAPKGRARWTLRLLADHFVTLSEETVSASTICRTLKKTP